MSAEAQNPQEDNNKVTKEFDKNLKTLVAIVGGNKNIYPTKKVSKDSLTTIVQGLLKDRKEDAEKLIKADLTAILDKKVALDKEIKAKEDELNKLKMAKYKEFNEAIKKVLSRIDDINSLEKEYYDSLNSSDSIKASKEE
jgi:hypothetical protein